MKKRFRQWVRNNKAYVIWVSIIMVYTFVMLGVIIFIRATDKEGQNSFTSRVNQVKEETTEFETEEETETEEYTTEERTTLEIDE